MFVYIRSTAFVIVVTQKLVFQRSKNVTAKCMENLSPPPCILYSLICIVLKEGVEEYSSVPCLPSSGVHLHFILGNVFINLNKIYNSNSIFSCASCAFRYHPTYQIMMGIPSINSINLH